MYYLLILVLFSVTLDFIQYYAIVAMMWHKNIQALMMLQLLLLEKIITVGKTKNGDLSERGGQL